MSAPIDISDNDAAPIAGAMAVDASPTASSDESDEVVIVQPAPARRTAPPIGRTASASQRLDFGDDDSDISVDASSGNNVLLADRPVAIGDGATEQMYAARRSALLAERLAALGAPDAVGAPTEATQSRPVQPLGAASAAAERPLVESSSTADAYLALEYGSAFLGDTRRVFQQGDEFGFSDTLAFSDGRAYTYPDRPEDNVPPKRVADVDAADNDPRQLEAANYQHAFHLSAGRTDATLPVTRLVESGYMATDADVRRIIGTLTETVAAADDNEDEDEDDATFERAALATLRRTRSGVPTLFADLSPAATGYETLRRRADLPTVGRLLDTSIEQARAVTERREPVAVRSVDADSLVLQASDALAETHEQATLPNMPRVTALAGAFKIAGGTLIYDLRRPAESLLAGAEMPGDEPMVGDKWAAVERLLADRLQAGDSGAPATVATPLAPAAASSSTAQPSADPLRDSSGARSSADNVAPIRRAALEAAASKQALVNPRPRKLVRRAGPDDELTIASEVGPGKRKRIAVEDDDASQSAPEPTGAEQIDDALQSGPESSEGEGSEIEGAALFDPQALERELAEENAEAHGIDVTQRVDRTAAGFVDATRYRWPSIAVPIGWSASEALRRLETAFAAPDDETWRGDAVWRDIVELAVFAKLVPELGDASRLPADAQLMLVDTLTLVAQRVTNELVAYTTSRDVFAKRRQIERLRAVNRAEEEYRAALKAVSRQAPDYAELAAVPRARLEEIKNRLAEEADGDLVPPSVVPAVLVLNVAPEAHTAYLREPADAAGDEFDQTQRVALAVAYAASGRRPGQQPLESDQFEPFAGQRADALYYPRAGSYDSAESMNEIFADAGVAAGAALATFAAGVGRSDLVPQADTVPQREIGAFIWRAYGALTAAAPERDGAYASELARAVYPALVERGTANPVRHIYCVSPHHTTPAATAEAIKFMDKMYNEFGVYDATLLVQQNEAEAQNATDAAHRALIDRGSERLYASAAQRDANEHFAADAYSLDERPLVPANFDPAVVRPVAVLTQVDGELAVSSEQTEAYLQSRALLGGGRVVTASAPLVPRIVGDERRALEERQRSLRDYVDQLRAAVNAARGESRDALLAQTYAAQDELAEIAPRLARLPADDAHRSTLEPFLFFVAPATLAEICARVATTPSTKNDVRRVCAAFRAWYDAVDARLLSPASGAVFHQQYRARVAALARDLAPVTGPTTQPEYARDAKVASRPRSVAEFVADAVGLLSNGARARLLMVPEETTRPDAVATLPFSCLAALERAATPTRRALRDALLRVWYSVATARRWARLGYTSLPFSTSHAVEMPLASAAGGALYDDYQTLYLALRSRLRDAGATARRRALDPRGALVDEGDSDDDADEPGAGGLTDSALSAQIAQERRAGVLEAQTLLNCLELEIPRLQMAQTLWFDLHGIGAEPASFVDAVGTALGALYDALVSGRGIAATSLLASRARASGEQPAPLAVDPRAQPLVDQFWRDYRTAEVQQERLNALADEYAQRIDEQSGLLDLIDTEFYQQVAALAAAQKVAQEPTQAGPSEETRRLAKLYELDRAAAAEVAESRNEEDANRRRPASALQSIGRLLDELRDAIKAEKTAYSVVAQAGAASEPLAEQALDKATDRVREKEQAVRACYGGADGGKARTERIDKLIDLVVELRNEKLDPSARLSALAKSVGGSVDSRLAAALAELRATIYPHERASYAARLNDQASVYTSQITRLVAEREKTAQRDEIRAKIEKLETDLAKAERSRLAQYEAQRDKDAKSVPKAERDRRRAAFPPFVVTDEMRRADRQTCLEAARLRVLRDTVGVDALDVAKIAEIRAKALASAPACAGLSGGDALTAALADGRPTAALDTALLGEALALRTALAANIKTGKTTLERREAAKRSDLRTKESIYRALARDIYPVVERMRRAYLSSKSTAEVEALEAAQAEIRRAMLKTRTDDDARLAKRLAAGVPRGKTERQHLPGADEPADDDGAAAYYDAPLANHKKASVDGLLVVDEIVGATRLPAEDAERLALATATAAEAGDYGQYVLDTARSILDQESAPSAGGKIRLATGARAERYPAILLRHLRDLVQAFVRRRVLDRYAVSKQARTLEPNTLANLTSKVLAAVNEVLDRQTTERTVGGQALRIVDRAALRLLQESYAAQQRAQRATALLESFGTITVPSGTGNLRVEMPRLAALLLLPAAIERAKIQRQQRAASAGEQPWAVANRQDAPQAWRIAEIVERYARTGRLPLPTAADAASSPYSQYAAIRQIASVDDAPLVAELGRLRYFSRRVAALRQLGAVAQRVSLGNGLHSSAPLAVDLALAALCAQLVRLYASVQTAFDANAVAPSIAQLWRATQENDVAADATRRIAALPSARDRLWAHLVMLFAQRGTVADSAFPIAASAGAVVLGMPVWRYMRTIDIRLLALVVLGYDEAPRVDRTLDDDDTDDAVRLDRQYAYTRGHTAKMMLAAAYYEQFVEMRFATRPTEQIVNDAAVASGVTPLFSVLRTDAGAFKQVMQYSLANQPRPTAAVGGVLVAQLDESAVLEAVRRQIYAAWTVSGATPLDVFGAAADLAAPEIGRRIRYLASTPGAVATQDAVAIAAMRERPYAAAGALAAPRVRDQPWLVVPRCALVGAFVQTALLAATTRPDGSLVRAFPGRRLARVAARERLLTTLERILLLVDDSGHLLRDDTRDSPVVASLPTLGSAALVSAAPVVKVEPGGATVADAPLAAPSTDVPAWRKRVQDGLKTLLGAPYDVRLVGTTRQAPFVRDENPFAPVPTSLRLEYAHQVLFVDGDWSGLWARMRATLVAVRAFYGASPADALPPVDAFAGSPAAAVLDAEQRQLGALLVRAERERRAYWQFDERGELLASNVSNQSLYLAGAVEASVYQPWHVLLLFGLAQDSTPKQAIAAYLDTKPTTNAAKYAEARVASGRALRALDVERCVPIYDTLLYYFDKTNRAGQPDLNTTAYRYHLWALLGAPLLRRAVVWLQSTEAVSAAGRVVLTLVDYAPLAARMDALRAYMPSTYAGYTIDGARAEALRISIADTSRVVVVHEHQFRNPRAAAGSRWAPLATLARVEPLGVAPLRPHTVDAALDASSAAKVLVNLGIPLAPS